MWASFVETAVVKKRKRPAIDKVSAVFQDDGALIHIPVGHVEGLILGDEAIKEAWGKIDPTLVSEPLLLGCTVAFPQQPLGPPCGGAWHRLTIYSHEAHVIDAA